jgi:hypothetical protein
LLFVENKPYPAKSYVCLGGYFDGEGKNGEPLLTPECVNPTELAVWIDDIKKQLDGIETKARRKYSSYEKRRWTDPRSE